MEAFLIMPFIFLSHLQLNATVQQIPQSLAMLFALQVVKNRIYVLISDLKDL